jgi:hypothetical protein
MVQFDFNGENSFNSENGGMNDVDAIAIGTIISYDPIAA